VKKDIKAVADAIEPARQGRIHTFIATSPIHREYKLKKSREQVLELIKESVSYAREFTDDVEWSAEDATRTEHDFLCQAVEAAIKAGATTINIPDTVGYALPHDYAARITMLRERVPGIEDITLSVHGQNDLGLATANSLAGVLAGVRQIECTINGIGERAGNTSLEEVVMAIRVRQDLMPFETGVDTTKIMPASKLISSITGFNVQPNKAIVGANAFAHESGIHQDGMLKHAETYEIMTPASVGRLESKIVLGKHSGRNAFKSKLHELGYHFEGTKLDEAFERFKRLADAKKNVYDDDLIALADEELGVESRRFKFVSLRVVAGSEGPQEAELTLEVDGTEKTAQTTGNGPVDATFNAIGELIPHDSQLLLYQVHAVTEGTDAQAEVSVRLEEDGRSVTGHAADADTLVASARAYIRALDKLLTKRQKSRPDAA